MTFGEATAASFRREIAYLRRSGWDLALLFVLPPIAIVVVAAVFFAGVFHNIPVGMVDADHSALSRAIERNLLANPKVRVVAMPTDLAAALPLVRSGRIYSIVYIPPGLEARAARREDEAVAIYFNAAFQTVGSQAADASRNAVQAAISANVGPTGIGPSAPAIRLHPPRVQVTIVGNSAQSFELFLEALVTPLVLNLLLSSAVVFAVGREQADATLADWNAACGGRFLAGLAGKLAPYVVVYWIWCVGWVAYLAGWRGWSVDGSLALLVLAQLVFFCATAAVGAFLAVMLWNVDLALSLSALYAGSGLSFSNATLTVNGGSLFTRLWSAVLPSTSYVRIQEQQWVLASPVASAAAPMLILLLFVAVPILIAARRLGRRAASPTPEKRLFAPPTPPGFAASFLQTLRVVAATSPILSTVVFSVVLYGFYYPAAYNVQTVVKLPIAVVDLDRSPLSRSFLRNLDATRETSIVEQSLSVAAAQALLRDDRVDGVVVVSDGLEASVLKGSPGGVAAYFKGAYLIRSRFLGQALGGAVQASVREALAPLAAAARSEASSIETIERPLFNTANGYGDYTVPGVASVILQATMLFGVAMFMGLKREGDSWRMTPAAFLGLWAAFTVLGALTNLFFFGFVLWFQDYPRGSDLAGLLICAPIFSAAVSALGMLVGSTFARHERSMQILGGTSIPVFFLSGLSWPAFAMPPLVQALARLIPSTAAVPLFVKLNSMGATLGEVAPEVLTLLVLAILYGLAAFLRLTGPASGPAIRDEPGPSAAAG
ncbi:MAG: ABC transporter permease [Caulobacteraceae bacterium]